MTRTTVDSCDQPGCDQPGCDQPGCDQPGLRSLEAAREALLARARCRVEVETCALGMAAGRVLARDVHSAVDVPPAANSAMDGYAVRTADLTAAGDIWLPVSQRIPAGQAPQPLAPGSAARIFTGAEIPPGADAVVAQERTLAEEGRVRLPAGIEPQLNIRPRGQDIHRGERILPAGSRLSPVALGVLASAGIAEVEVYRPLRVALLSTGDELVEPGQPLAPGQIYNSNRYLLQGLLHGMGMEVVDLGAVADTPQATESALRRAAAEADLILTTGGVSVGEEDHVKAAIERLGTLDLWKVNIKPGKPFAAGDVAGVPLYGLPGNPGSALVTFALLAKPCLLAAQGARVDAPFSVPVRAGFARSRVISRDEFVRVSCDQQGVAHLHAGQSSGVLSSLLLSNGLVRIPGGSAVERGQPLDFYPLATLLQ